MKYNAVLSWLMIFLFLMVFSSCSEQEVSSKPDIILITIDTVRSDHVGAYGYERNTTPFIDSLAEQGTVFKHTITPIPITGGGHATIITGLHPVTHQLLTNGNDYLKENVQTIAEVMKQHGYYTVGAVGTKLLSSKYGFQQGFDAFADEYKGWELNARQVNKNLFQHLDAFSADSENNKKPLFVWLHYYDPHAPYTRHGYKFDKPVPKRFVKDRKGIDNYDHEIRYSDDAVKEVYDYLNTKLPGRQWISCITSDHGEQQGDHYGWNIHCDFYTETVRVPLILHGPGIPRKTIRHPVSSVDIAETLVSFVGGKFKYKTDGFNLFQAPEKDRDFLVVGHPYDIKSLQVIRFPWSYILNNDYLYEYWYIADKVIPPGVEYKTVRKKNLSIGEKKKKMFTFHVPDAFQDQLLYAVVSAEVSPQPEGKKTVIANFNQRLTTQWNFDESVKSFTVAQQVTTLDRYQLKFDIVTEPGTEIINLNYALLTEKEFAGIAGLFQRQQSRVYRFLRTPRKKIKMDELFNLEDDPGMLKNLLETGPEKYADQVPGYRAAIFKWFKHYRSRGRKLFGGRSKGQLLTDKQVQMLKSLGYL